MTAGGGSVLHVISRAASGGAWRGTLELTSELKARWGWDVVICVLGSDEGHSDRGSHGDVPIVYLNAPPHIRGTFLRRLSGLRKTIHAVSPVIVHSHLWPTAFSVALARAVSARPHLVHIRDTPQSFVSRTWRARCRTEFMSCLLRTGGAKFIAVSRDAADHTVRYLRVRPENVKVVLNGVSPCQIQHGRAVASRAGVFTIGMAGRLVTKKANAEMIKTLARLRGDGADVRLKIAGDGSQRAELQKLAADQGVEERVEFSGDVSDMGAFYASLDCFVHCALHGEGLPRVLMEAALAGVPVVTTSCAGARDVFPNSDYGLVLDHPTVEHITTALHTMIDEPVEAQAMARRTRERAERLFTVARVAAEINDVYHELLHKPMGRVIETVVSNGR